MATFQYQGRNNKGETVKGSIEASSSKTVADQLIQKQIIPINIKKISIKKFGLFSLLKSDIGGSRVKLIDYIAFCRQMYTITKAGIPIIRALNRIIESTRSKLLSKTLQGVLDNISAGKSFSASLKQFPKVFPPVFISIIEAGESSGQLEEAFSQLEIYLSLEEETIKRVKAAVRYPILVVSAIFIALGVVNFMVIPAFSSLFASYKKELPLATKIMMGTSNFLVSNWPYILLFVFCSVIGIVYTLKTKKGRLFWDKWKLKVPIFGGILHRIALGRFARTFGMLVRTGVPLVRGLTLVAGTLGNDYIRDNILIMRDRIEVGATFSKMAEESGLFTALSLQMISIGEETGNIDQMLQEIAEYYEREVDYDLKDLSSAIEPILLFVMGGMVTLLAIGVFLPMWDMASFAG